MKIGIYDPYLDSLGGGEKYMLSAAVCLSEEHKVSVFWDDAAILQKANERFHLDLKKVNIVKNIFSSDVSTLQRFTSTSKYDTIFFLSDGSIPVTMAKKTILHFQFPVEWVNGKSLVSKIKFQKISKVVCNSNYTKKYIDRKFGIHSIVLYPPCGDTEHPVDVTKNKKNIVFTVGRYNHLSTGGSFKKHEVMIDTWKQMIDAGVKDWKFVLATSYLEDSKKYVDQLEKLIANYPIEIIRNGSYESIQRLYKEAKIYWHASGYGENLEKHPERTEHFGISTVEAMYNGAVPIVINAGGQKEIIIDGVDGFLWETLEELKQYTHKLIGHDTILTKMSKAAQEKSGQFSTQRFCKELNRIILGD